MRSMTRPAQAAATAALEVTSRPTRLRLSDSTADTGGSREVLARLATAVSELKALSLQPLLQNAVACLNGGNTTDGAAWAIKALEVDERSGFGWYLLAIAREQSGDFPAAITCYETALRLLPDHGELANNLGRLAFRLGQSPVAEKLFRLFLERFPNHPEGANNLACALREQGRYEEAIEVLRASLLDNPGHALVWNTLGTVMAEQGDAPNALVFFDEALRLAPDLAKAQYNRGNMALALGKLTAALSDCEAALAIATSPDERQMMRLARSTILINLGRVGEGWDEYEARLHPQFSDVTRFLIDRPRWEPGTGVAGKSVLVIAEQGLGDEILFANVLADLNRDLGPSGRLTLAVEPAP